MKQTPLKRTPMKRRPKKATPKLEKDHMARVGSLACVVGDEHCAGRTTVHHLSGAGMGRRASNFDTIPLCEGHHLHGRYSIEHMGSKAWEACHQPQRTYLYITRLALAKLYPDWNPLTGEPFFGCSEDLYALIPEAN